MEKKNHGLLKALLAIGIIVGLLYVGYKLYQKYFLEEEENYNEELEDEFDEDFFED